LDRLVAARPNLFSIPFGLTGLASVWHLMANFYGTPLVVSDAISVVAAVIWLALLAGAARRWTSQRGSFGRELRDPVFSPFLALPPIIGVLLSISLEPHAHGLAEVIFIACFVVTIAIGGWITGEWVLGELDPSRFHPGYFLPTCAGGFICASGAAVFGLEGLGWLAFGFGAISWLILASQVSGRLFFVGRLPEALVPTMAIEMAPPCVGGAAYFQLHGLSADPVAYTLAGYAGLMVLVQLRLTPIYLRLDFSAGFWSFTFSWCAAAALAIRWIEVSDPAGATVWAALITAAASILVAAIAARSLLALTRPVRT
jgi:tellurite resistance protein